MSKGPDQSSGQTEDPRFTYGLVRDVFKILEQHGYQRPEGAGETERNRATGASLAALLTLVETFEGKPHD